MRIGVIAYCLLQEHGGGISNYNYLYNMLRSLASIDKENEYFLYSPVDLNINFLDNPKWHVRKCRGLLNKSSTIWQLFFSKKYVINDNLDIFWATQNILAADLPKSILKILTVYDIKWRTHLLASRWDTLITEKIFAKQSIFNADHVIVSSYSTRNKIKQLVCNEIDSKCSVVYHGISEDFLPYDKKESAEYISEKYKTNHNFILHVSVPSPIKNIKRLLYAFENLLNKGIKIQLLIAGGYGWRNQELFKIYRKLQFTEKEVKFLGYIPTQDLPKLYAAAKVFVTVSLEEGFCFPVVEAMKCGTPVVCSNIDTLREIADNCAIYVDPYNIENIANGLYKIITEENLSAELAKNGINRSGLFSWSKAAKEMLVIFHAIYKK